MNSLKGAHVMVTGGCGFIGSHLVRELMNRGAQRVVALDSLRYGDKANLGELGGVDIVQHTLGMSPRSELESAMEGITHVFHLAAEKHNQSKDDPERVYQANVVGTHRLYDVAVKQQVKKVVFSSSLYAYGRLSGPPCTEDEVAKPETVYGVTKLAGEHMLRHFERQHGLAWNVIRYFFVYGPKQFAGMGYKSVIIKNFERLLAGKAPTVYGDGKQALDYVFVDDAVDATILAMESEVRSETLNVATGRAVTVNELLDTMISVSGRNVEKESAPADWTAGSCRVGNPDGMAEKLGWRAGTSLQKGLSRTFDWMKG